MSRIAFALALAGLFALAGCETTPVPGGATTTASAEPAPTLTVRELDRLILERATLLFFGKHLSQVRVDRYGDIAIDGGSAEELWISSAAPITPDGYFLTAYHSVHHPDFEDTEPWLLHFNAGNPKAARVRIVWDSEESDLALVKAALPTDHYYEWTPVGETIPVETRLRHGGFATGLDGVSGYLVEPLRPDRLGRTHEFFIHSAETVFGDSGGPLVDPGGRLIAVNSMIRLIAPLETAFFVDSAASRPNVPRLMRLIERDRAATRTSAPAAEEES